MKNEQNSKVDINSLAGLIDLMVFFVLFVYFGWNFFVAFILSAIVGWFIKRAWSKGIVDPENAPRLVAMVNRWWWAIVVLSIAPLLWILMAAPGHLTPIDYIFGELFIGGALAYAGWVDWTHGRKLRAVLFFLSVAGWALLALDMFMFRGDENNAIERIRTLETTTAMALFITLGFSALAFLWSLIESLVVREKADDYIQSTHPIVK